MNNHEERIPKWIASFSYTLSDRPTWHKYFICLIQGASLDIALLQVKKDLMRVSTITLKCNHTLPPLAKVYFHTAHEYTPPPDKPLICCQCGMVNLSAIGIMVSDQEEKIEFLYDTPERIVRDGRMREYYYAICASKVWPIGFEYFLTIPEWKHSYE